GEHHESGQGHSVPMKAGAGMKHALAAGIIAASLLAATQAGFAQSADTPASPQPAPQPAPQSEPQPAKRPAAGTSGLNLKLDDSARRRIMYSTQDQAPSGEKNDPSAMDSLPGLGGTPKDEPRRNIPSGRANPFPKDMTPGY